MIKALFFATSWLALVLGVGLIILAHALRHHGSVAMIQVGGLAGLWLAYLLYAKGRDHRPKHRFEWKG